MGGAWHGGAEAWCGVMGVACMAEALPSGTREWERWWISTSVYM